MRSDRTLKLNLFFGFFGKILKINRGNFDVKRFSFKIKYFFKNISRSVALKKLHITVRNVEGMIFFWILRNFEKSEKI